MATLLRTARAKERRVYVPAMCVAEWWRGRTDLREKILEWVTVVHTDDALLKVTGEALAEIPTATAVDAIVMATAARHGPIVFTSDVEDLQRLQKAFRAVRVLAA